MQIFLDYFPNNVFFHLMVAMNEEVSHSRNLPPWGKWMAFAKLKSEHISGFPYNHNIVNHSMIAHVIGNKYRHIVISNILENVVDGFQNVGKPFRIFTRFSHKSIFCHGRHFRGRKAKGHRQ